MEFLATCHVHSKWSYDGSWTLEALSSKFSRRGSRVLMMTEHDRGFSESRFAEYRDACAKVSSEKILVVPGIEYSDKENRVHVLVWGKVPFLGENLPTGEMLKMVHDAGGFAVLAHPSRRDAWEMFEPSWANHLLGIEIWNRKYDGWASSKTAPALLRTSAAVPFVGLDFHTQRQTFSLSMALDIQGDVTEETVLESLRSRRCSARAYGFELDHSMAKSAMPLLRIAERGRKKAARIIKSRRRASK
jgi:hypothetical protein